MRLSRGQQINGDDFVVKDAGIPYRGTLLNDAYIVVGSNEKPSNTPELRGVVTVRRLGELGLSLGFGDFYATDGEQRAAIPYIGFPKVETGHGLHSMNGEGILPVAGFSLDIDELTTHALAKVRTPEGQEYKIGQANLDDRNNASGTPFNIAAILYAIENSAYRAIGADVPVH